MSSPVQTKTPSASASIAPRTRGTHRLPADRRACPDYVGQLGFYVAWVEENLRDRDRHAPTIGILLCAGRNDSVVRYSLAGASAPLAIADYTYDTLPAHERGLLPGVEQ